MINVDDNVTLESEAEARQDDIPILVENHILIAIKQEEINSWLFIQQQIGECLHFIHRG